MAVLRRRSTRELWPLAYKSEAYAYFSNGEAHECLDCASRDISYVRFQIYGSPVGFLCTDCAKAQMRENRNRRLRFKREAERGDRDCENCGETYEPARMDSRFCSNACRQKAHRNRKASEVASG